jgi:hypothetical protein
MKIESKIGKSKHTDREIYQFVTDFNNFKEFIPEDQVMDWESTEDSCTFRIDPVGKTGIKIIEKDPYRLVKVSSIPGLSQYDFTIWIQLLNKGGNETNIKITIEPRVNQMLLPFIKTPLKDFADGLIDRIENFNFS